MQRILTKLEPYYRLGRFDKPIGSWLVYWPCSYASVLASSYGDVHLGWLACAFASSFMIRAAGCAANDIWDRKIDRQVERTKSRPIASGELSVLQGAGFCAFNLVPVPVIWSLMGVNGMPLLYSTIPVILAYPLAKRFTHWPQAALGVSINYGFLVNYLFLTNTFEPFLIPMSAGLWCWTMIYDSIYAYQDIKDDKKVGVKSTAVLWGEDHEKYFKALTLGMAGSYALTGYMVGFGLPYYGVLMVAMSRVRRQWRNIDTGSPEDCLKRFKDSYYVGRMMFLAFLLGKLTQVNKEREVSGEDRALDINRVKVEVE